jgi:hypothetical protein
MECVLSAGTAFAFFFMSFLLFALLFVSLGNSGLSCPQCGET